MQKYVGPSDAVFYPLNRVKAWEQQVMLQYTSDHQQAEFTASSRQNERITALTEWGTMNVLSCWKPKS